MQQEGKQAQAKPLVEILSSELDDIHRELNRQLTDASKFTVMMFLGKTSYKKKHSIVNHLLNNIFSCSKGNQK